jgi:tetratricopeptide (TPR) repeat protein
MAAPARGPLRGSHLLAGLLLLGLLFLAYANHFGNSFHFDDFHAIRNNPFVRDIHNFGRFFTDARTLNVNPLNQTYRPLTIASAAVDYWLGHSFNPLWFHVSTFLWFLVLLGPMLVLFRRAFDAALPDPRNAWPALLGTALFALHPAVAETVNYIYQRGDIYSTLAVVAGLVLYARAPGARRYGLYLLPVVVGLFAKQPTAVFPALLVVWIWLFERTRLTTAILRSLPAFIVTGAVAYFVLRMNASTFIGGASSAYAYRISQPAVLLSYFRRFFFPLDLRVDTDRLPYTSLAEPAALYGFVFVALAIGAFFALRRRRQTTPLAFAVAWFLISCLPTSWVPLAEVENDHRLFFPFVGVALGVAWACALWLYRHPVPRGILALACTAVFALEAWGTHLRNIVWHTEESLWLDVTRKSPGNGRGLMNYGLTQMAQGRNGVALDYFTRSLALDPGYPTLEINLGIVNGALHHPAEAERHFQEAVRLSPGNGEPEMYYARWLDENARGPDALAHVRRSLSLDPNLIESHHLLMRIDAQAGDTAALRAAAADTLRRFPTDPDALGWQAKLAQAPAAPAAALPRAAAAPQAATPQGPTTAQGYFTQSLALYRAGKYPESIASARVSLLLWPDNADAWNTVMAAYNSLGDWDQAILAGEEALRIDPSNKVARNNLIWAKAQKKKARAGTP